MSDDPPIDPTPDPPEPPEPAPEEPTEPVAEPVSPLETNPLQFDAPHTVRGQFFQGSGATIGGNVARPGDAETAGGAPRGAVRGDHNWVPIGPRNVGGRVRCLAIDPANGSIVYAGPASGGIYKSLDSGESWFPLWHDEPSLSIGAIAISPSATNTVWAGTGESSTGGGERIASAGVWRSTDSGVTWAATAAARTAFGRARVAALAPHPTDPAVCWAATDIGVFRTTNSGATWQQYAARQGYSDAVILTVGANVWVFLAMSGFQTLPGPPVTQNPVIVRIQNPSIAHATLQGILPNPPAAPPNAPTPPPAVANTFPIPAAPAGPSGLPANGSTSAPADGKLAAFPLNGGVGPFLYAAWARQDRSLYRVFRLANLDAVAGGNPNLTVSRLANHANFGDDSQGEYNLAIAVNPQNAAEIAFGMQEMYINLSATANPSQPNHWLQAQNQFLYVVDRGHHADHHNFVIAPHPPAPFGAGVGAGADWLWDANDGGISVSADWQAATGEYTGGQQALPLPAGVPTWQKRSHGISASQMYDLTQHPRLPSVLGCGFQDNGTFLSTGGMSWDLIFTADGGFVAFDPDDPYRVLATYQSGITEARFPGRIRDISPLLRDGAQTGTRPRELTDGFRGSDRSLFVAETVFHPTRPGRVLHSRKNRLYGTRPTTGDRWHPQPVGSGIEIIHEPTAAGATAGSIEVRDTIGAMAIGLLPQRNEMTQTEDRALGARARTILTEPFTVVDGDHLLFVVHNNAAGQAAVNVDIPLAVSPDLPALASADQLARHITANGGGLTALPVVWARSQLVTLFTRQTGRANTIRLGGTAMANFTHNSARVSTGANANGAFGTSALPAVAFLDVRPAVVLGGTRLSVTRNGRPQRDIDFAAGAIVGVQELAARLRGALATDDVLVATNDVAWGVRLTATAGGNRRANVTGTGAANFFNQPRAPARSFSINDDLGVTGGVVGHRFDFTPPPPAIGPPPPPPALRIRVRETVSGNQTANLNFTTAVLGTADITHVTPVELVHSIRTQLAAGAANVQVRCDLDLNPVHDNTWDPSNEGSVAEVAFAPSDPTVVWAGDVAGRMYLSKDGGDVWRQVTALPILDLVGEVDGIAVHPEDPRTVFVGVYAEGSFAAAVPGFLFRTTDEGGRWDHVGAQIVDATGGRIGVRAVEIDPANTDHVFAATDLGVWWSHNGGTDWEEFNHGLPNARVTDLSFEPRLRLLRAGVWGRGVHERHVGDDPVKDVRLHLRTTALDDGWSQPVPGPDVAAAIPASLPLDRSPDIKHTLSDPRRGLVLDGVEFDEDIRNEDVREGNAFVTVQVNNRGAFPTDTARVALLWAPADDGPPLLPGALWDALAAGPLVAAATFEKWTVIDDVAIADPQGVGHHVVAPGYPRSVVLGAGPPPFKWPAGVNDHRRVGLLALARSADDVFARGPDNVFDLVHAEAKAAYRECDVVSATAADTIVLRATTATGFSVAAPGGGLDDTADGLAPFGLAAVGAATTLVEFTTAGPYNLSAAPTKAFRLQSTHNVTVTFAQNDPAIRNLGRAFADEVAAVINRSLIDAGIPVRADGRSYPGGVQDAVAVTPLGAARVTITAASTAAAALGLPTGVTRPTVANPNFITAFASKGPFNLGLIAGNPRTLILTVVVDALVQFPATTREIPALATATAGHVRAAINRQCREAGIGVVAERRRTSVAVRRSPTEAAASRVVTGGFGLGDLVVVPGAEVAAGTARDALFDVVTTFGPDVLVRSATNRLYLRSANTGNVNIAQVRHRLFHLTLSPFGVANVGTTVNEARSAGISGVAALTWDVPALAAGSRAFVLAIADTVADPLDPTAAGVITTIEQAHEFCLKKPNAALREFVVA